MTNERYAEVKEALRLASAADYSGIENDIDAIPEMIHRQAAIERLAITEEEIELAGTMFSDLREEYRVLGHDLFAKAQGA